MPKGISLTWQNPGQHFVAQELIKIIINHVAELREVTNDKKEIARSFYGSALYY